MPSCRWDGCEPARADRPPGTTRRTAWPGGRRGRRIPHGPAARLAARAQTAEDAQGGTVDLHAAPREQQAHIYHVLVGADREAERGGAELHLSQWATCGEVDGVEPPRLVRGVQREAVGGDDHILCDPTYRESTSYLEGPRIYLENEPDPPRGDVHPTTGGMHG